MKIDIGKHSVGDDSEVFVIAEIGSNHNNDLSVAKEMIEAASSCGANAVKFQTFKASQHYSKYTPKINIDSYDNVDVYELIESLEINREWHLELQQCANECGVEFFSSPCDREAVDLLKDINAVAYKVSSFDLLDLDLIGYIAKSDKPVILSTGLAKFSEIERAIEVCYDYDNKDVVLLQCTSMYPAPARLSNLNAIETLRRSFGVLAGYSDHTVGDHVALAAVVKGACVIEKHFTLDQNMPGPDHRFSIEPNDFSIMISKIRDIESSLGDGIKNGPRREERDLYEKARRSIHAARDLKEGEVVGRSDIMIKRPSYGISPMHKEFVIGRRVNKNIKKDYWITMGDLC